MPFNFETTDKNDRMRKGVNNGFFNKYVSNPTNNIIFTKDEVVEKVLDTLESQDPDAFNSITKKYCDIGCKSGAYLCGIADRIFDSPIAKKKFPNELGRWRHIFKYQLFGVTSNKILQRVSQMRVYNIIDSDGENLFDDCWCNIISTDLLGDPSKFEPEDIMKRFNEIENFTTVEDINKYGEREIKKMSFEKFDYIIGNPPYQVRKGTTNINIWQSFIEKGSVVSDKMCMIHPGRWVVPKKSMEKVRDLIINSDLSYFDYYPNIGDVFEGTNIDGGISITYFDKNSDSDITYSVKGEFKGKYNKETKVFENIFEEEAYNKAMNCVGSTIEHRVLGSTGGYGSNEFGFDNALVRDLLKKTPEECTNPIKVWANADGGMGTRFNWCYIDKEHLDNDKYSKVTASRKIMFSKNGNSLGACGNIINNEIQIVDRDVTAMNVFFVVPESDTDYDLKLLKSYFETKTVRFFMSITQKDHYVRGFENVPDYTYFIDELNGELFTDEFFYNKYNFSPELIKYIEANIAEK